MNSFSARILRVLCLALLTTPMAAIAGEKIFAEISDQTEVEIRVFKTEGDLLLLGFACDEGSSTTEEETAGKLADSGIEVWMPDMISAYWLPNVPSSRAKIPGQSISDLASEAHLQTGKDIYLLAAGGDVGLVLRGLAQIEQDNDLAQHVKGAIIMFPRVLKGEPDPGKEPEYIDAVGGTTSPLLVLEGGRTPNRWGLPHLVAALERGGSLVKSLVVPDIRGYFYKREDANAPEDTVTLQMHGLIKASLYQLRNDL